jgi:hypothetical protein
MRMFNLIFLIVGAAIGAGILYFLGKGKFFNTAVEERQNASIVLQKIERVFKVVTAEGHFSEVFDYSQTQTFASLIPSTKKALLIVNAKVMMGYDFKKMQMEYDEATQQIKILSFPQPEILSMEPDIKYYNMENGLFNKFDNNDLTQLQSAAKQKILTKVAESELPQIAQKQMSQLLQELGSVNHWNIQGADRIMLPSPSAN